MNNSGLSSKEQGIIAVFGVLGGFLSIMGSLSILLMFSFQYCNNRKLFFYQKLIAYLSISDILWSSTITFDQLWYLGINIFLNLI